MKNPNIKKDKIVKNKFMQSRLLELACSSLMSSRHLVKF